MKALLGATIAAMFAAASTATAEITLQMDINGFQVQAKDGSGANSAFGGLGHTGSIDFDTGPFAVLNSVSIRHGNNPPVDQNFSGSLVSFDGNINFSNGLVTGGSLVVTVSSGDSYTCSIVPNSGFVSNYVGGGFKVEGLTFDGAFSDAMFSNVDVQKFFEAQGIGNNLLGSLLQFNFEPNEDGSAYADMDLFVVVPLPPAGWAGLATLGGVMALGYLRRRK